MDLAEWTMELKNALEFTAHWDRHAWVMFTIWIILVPFVVVITRFGKPRPSAEGIPKASPKLGRKLLWFTLHRAGLFLLTLASLFAGLIAIAANGGLSTSLHAFFGNTTIALGLLQLVSAWLRGTHGGRDPSISTPDQPAFIPGDHYDMSPRRRWFEAVHKTVGYFTLVSALGAVATGLAHYWIMAIAIGLGLVVPLWAAIAIALEAKGLRHDTYLANFGTGNHHPFNKSRMDELTGD